jgi:starch synthase (maltosyl-transferring)
MANYRVGRIPVMDVAPVVGCGRFPAKAAVGETFEVAADVFREGHDQLGCDVVLTDPGGRERAPVRMEPVAGGVNRYTASVTVDEPGEWSYAISSWSDPLATWSHDAGIKVRAGVDTELMFTEGVLLLKRLAKAVPKDEARLVRDAVKACKDTKRPVEARLAAAEDPALLRVFHEHPLRDLESREGPFPLYVDRRRALFSSW